MRCFAIKACTRAVEWAGALIQIRWSARSVIVNATVTQHKFSQRRLTADWLAPRKSDCSRMHSKISSDRLPSYIKATRLVLEIFKMAGYFPDRPRKWFCTVAGVEECDLPAMLSQPVLLEPVMKVFYVIHTIHFLIINTWTKKMFLINCTLLSVFVNWCINQSWKVKAMALKWEIIKC